MDSDNVSGSSGSAPPSIPVLAPSKSCLNVRNIKLQLDAEPIWCCSCFDSTSYYVGIIGQLLSMDVLSNFSFIGSNRCSSDTLRSEPVAWYYLYGMHNWIDIWLSESYCSKYQLITAIPLSLLHLESAICLAASKTSPKHWAIVSRLGRNTPGQILVGRVSSVTWERYKCALSPSPWR